MSTQLELNENGEFNWDNRHLRESYLTAPVCFQQLWEDPIQAMEERRRRWLF